MNITAELSLYSLTDDYVPIIQSYIEVLNKVDGLEVRTHALSTEIFGKFSLVMETIQKVTEIVFKEEPATILVAKYLNRDRRDK